MKRLHASDAPASKMRSLLIHRLKLLCAALLITVPMISQAVFRCEDEQGNITFRDTPCPVRPDQSAPTPSTPRPDGRPLTSDHPHDWLSIAQIANQIRLNSPISQVEHLLGEPEDQEHSGIRARYVFELPVLRGMTYRAEIHTVNNRVTAIHDTFRRHYLQGVIAPGMLYDEILMTWGEPDSEQLRRTRQGIETTLSYTTDERRRRGHQVTLRNDVIVSIQYDVALSS